MKRFKGSLGLRIVVGIGAALLAFFAFCLVSLNQGGHMAGPTYIAPGNVGLVIDNYNGVVEKTLMPAGTHFQGVWETVLEVPTAQRTISLERHADGTGGGVLVNTASNMLEADVTAQYSIRSDKVGDLYGSYQDQFAEIGLFEEVHLIPAIKEAINYALGDTDTADAMTAAGKERAASAALKALETEWAPRGIDFHNLLIRGIDLDDESKALLSETVEKQQQIDNARLTVQQQQIDNKTILQKANADATINRLQSATLTDLYVQDKLLERVQTVYMPSSEILGMLKDNSKK